MTKAVKNRPKPLLPTYIHSFMGFGWFLSQVREGFFSIVSALKALTKKQVKFEWAKNWEKSFQELKKSLTSAQSLLCLSVMRITLFI